MSGTCFRGPFSLDDIAPAALVQFEETLGEAWEEFPKGNLTALLDCIPRRRQAVIDAKVVTPHTEPWFTVNKHAICPLFTSFYHLLSSSFWGLAHLTIHDDFLMKMNINGKRGTTEGRQLRI